VMASSAPAFGQAVSEQRPLPAAGLFLVIQEPVHDMNSRSVPKPEVKVSSTTLARAERGKGGIVAARLELSATGSVEKVAILYTSRTMDEKALEKLVGQRVGVKFETEKGHRTAVYVTFRLTHRFELLGTAVAFPKCCCSGVWCA
jgi:hypothetical protein